MTDGELIAEIEAQAQLMIDVATGGARIEDVKTAYKERRDRIRDALDRRSVDDPNPHTDLWRWHARYSKDLGTYASRRAHIAELYDPLIERIKRGGSARPRPATAPPVVEFNIPPGVLAGVCVVEAPFQSGTAFSIGFGMFVTCDHTTKDESGRAVELHLIRADRPTEEHPARIIRSWPEHDLAVLGVRTLIVPTLTVLPQGMPPPGTRAMALGFPDYAPGNTIQQVPIVTTGERTIAGIAVAVVEGGIRAGMSGGPVVDDQGQVIGVAQRGGRSHDDAEREHHGFIPARRLFDLVVSILDGT